LDAQDLFTTDTLATAWSTLLGQGEMIQIVSWKTHP
jgi:hypothetical protein